MEIDEIKSEVVLKARVSGEIRDWLNSQIPFRQKGNVTSKALEFYYDYHKYRKGFLIRLIEMDFDLIRHLLRQIGRIRKNAEVSSM